MAVYKGCSYRERFADAVSSNVHHVFLMEDIKQMDNYSQLGIKSAIERGRISNSNSDEVCLWDAIIILSCGTLDSRSRASSSIKQRFDIDKDKVAKCEKGVSPYVSMVWISQLKKWRSHHLTTGAYLSNMWTQGLLSICRMTYKNGNIKSMVEAISAHKTK